MIRKKPYLISMVLHLDLIEKNVDLESTFYIDEYNVFTCLNPILDE